MRELGASRVECGEVCVEFPYERQVAKQSVEVEDGPDEVDGVPMTPTRLAYPQPDLKDWYQDSPPPTAVAE